MINQLKTVMLLAAMNALLIALGWLLGSTLGAAIALGFAMVVNFGSWFYSDRLVLSSYQARPVESAEYPELYAMVERLARRAELPMPALYIVAKSGANAFATGRDPDHAAVAVTEGLLRLLPKDELEAVIAHELSHIAHRDTLIMAVAVSIAGAISWLTWLPSLVRGRSQGAQAILVVLSVMLAPVIALLLRMSISRSREFEADAGAGRLTQNPLALARALQRLNSNAASVDIGGNSAYQALLIFNQPQAAFWATLFSTHPPASKRIEQLRALEVELAAQR